MRWTLDGDGASPYRSRMDDYECFDARFHKPRWARGTSHSRLRRLPDDQQPRAGGFRPTGSVHEYDHRLIQEVPQATPPFVCGPAPGDPGALHRSRRLSCGLVVGRAPPFAVTGTGNQWSVSALLAVCYDFSRDPVKFFSFFSILWDFVLAMRSPNVIYSGS